MKKMISMTDRCSGQYKINITSLMHACTNPILIYWLWTTWIPTSHGKNACDGLAGTFKGLTAEASLQRTASDLITIPADFLALCESNVKGVICILNDETDEMN